jgi:hypothetical protein
VGGQREHHEYVDGEPQRHGRLRLTRGGLFVWASLCLLACSSSTGDETAPASTTSFVLLPGEDLFDAQDRIVDGCMDETNEPFVLGDEEVNGVTRTSVRAYDTNNPGTEERYESCRARWDELAQIPAPSDADLRVGYVGTVAFVRCLADRGYELGTVISEEEYVASGGQTDPSSNWAATADGETPGFSDDYDDCAAESFADPTG